MTLFLLVDHEHWLAICAIAKYILRPEHIQYYLDPLASRDSLQKGAHVAWFFGGIQEPCYSDAVKWSAEHRIKHLVLQLMDLEPSELVPSKASASKIESRAHAALHDDFKMSSFLWGERVATKFSRLLRWRVQPSAPEQWNIEEELNELYELREMLGAAISEVDVTAPDVRRRRSL